MGPDFRFIPFPSRPGVRIAWVPRSTSAAAASPAGSAGRRPGPLRGPAEVGQDPDTFTRHGQLHRLIRLYPGEEPAQPVVRVPAVADLPTTAGFVTVEAEITARTPHLVHVLHTDDTGKTLGTWLPPRLVRPSGVLRRSPGIPPTNGGGGEDGGHE